VCFEPLLFQNIAGEIPLCHFHQVINKILNSQSPSRSVPSIASVPVHDHVASGVILEFSLQVTVLQASLLFDFLEHHRVDTAVCAVVELLPVAGAHEGRDRIGLAIPAVDRARLLGRLRSSVRNWRRNSRLVQPYARALMCTYLRGIDRGASERLCRRIGGGGLPTCDGVASRSSPRVRVGGESHRVFDQVRAVGFLPQRTFAGEGVIICGHFCGGVCRNFLLCCFSVEAVVAPAAGG